MIQLRDIKDNNIHLQPHYSNHPTPLPTLPYQQQQLCHKRITSKTVSPTTQYHYQLINGNNNTTTTSMSKEDNINNNSQLRAKQKSKKRKHQEHIINNFHVNIKDNITNMKITSTPERTTSTISKTTN